MTTGRVSRRTFLGGIGAVAGSALWPVRTGRARSPTALSEAAFSQVGPVTAAMHVHASWSEGAASWQAQFAQARSIGCDLIFLTDHDYRALAYDYLPNLDGVPYVTSSSGSLKQSQATAADETLRLLAESSNTAPATLIAAVETRPTMWDHVRTSIAGTVLHHTVNQANLAGGATYEVVVQLSLHPATGSRPAGQYSLRYRYGSSAPARRLEGNGLTGVVSFGPTPPGTTHDFDLTSDVQAFWPDLQAIDNSLFALSFVATSPRTGAVADVARGQVSFTRTGHDEASIRQQQAGLVQAYGPQFPGLRMRPSVEVSQFDPHVNLFGVPQVFPDQAAITPDNLDAFYTALTADTQRQGGLVSWNHAFGANAGPLLSTPQQVTKRRQVFSDMLDRAWYGVDLLEVGYTVRGSVSTQTHLDLWDTFSRRAVFLTGNGVNDDHGGQHWASLSNGWTTGIWSTSSADTDVLAALRSGRAYTRHAGRWPNGQIDLSVDNSVAMGKAAVRNSGTSRSLAVSIAKLPKGSVVELVRGPVDGTGSDPGTSVISRISASAFGTSGLAARRVDTTRSCFVRAQVRTSVGTLIGTSNPVWLLRSTPAAGIPPPRLP